MARKNRGDCRGFHFYHLKDKSDAGITTVNSDYLTTGSGAIGGSATVAYGWIALAIAILLIAITRMVSVGSVVGTLTVAALVIIKNWLNIPLTAVSVIVAAIIVIAHLPNIQRIMEGRERRLDRIEWENREETKREDASEPADDKTKTE